MAVTDTPMLIRRIRQDRGLAGVRSVNLMVNLAEVTVSVDNSQYSPVSQVASIGELNIVGRVLYRLGPV